MVVYDDVRNLVLLNDPVLRPYLTAREEPARLAALECIVRNIAQPVVSRVLRQCRRNVAAAADELHDLESSVIVRVLQKLESARRSVDDAVAKLDEYVARLAINAVADLRRRFAPEWTRLKRQLRYAAATDPRLALWDVPSGTLCGLAEWRDRVDMVDAPRIDGSTLPAAPRDALAALLAIAGAPVLLDAVTAALAKLWQVESPRDDGREASAEADSPAAEYETREQLQIAWEEICELPLNQRAALLLNLRDAAGRNAVVLFPLTSVATFDEIAETMGVTPEGLTELWPRLPLADLEIAETLAIERQQVINLRKAARARLQRRIARRQKGARRESRHRLAS